MFCSLFVHVSEENIAISITWTISKCTRANSETVDRADIELFARVNDSFSNLALKLTFRTKSTTKNVS